MLSQGSASSSVELVLGARDAAGGVLRFSSVFLHCRGLLSYLSLGCMFVTPQRHPVAMLMYPSRNHILDCDGYASLGGALIMVARLKCVAHSIWKI